MGAALQRHFGFDPISLRARIVGIYLFLIAINVAAWMWSLMAFRHFPILLGSAFLAYGLGIRHAIDADHIAAIDNVTRKLMQKGQRPMAVGFFFSIGHSTIVVLASIVISCTANRLKADIEFFRVVGSAVGTMISALSLLVIAAMNVTVFLSVYRAFRGVRRGEQCVEEDVDLLMMNRGLLARVLRPMFGLISRSWHMYFLGMVFGLGFDTATEIGLLGISAAEAAKGLPLFSILVFPALFTAGMSAVDTTDSIVMLGAYGWGFVKPIRKLYYNMTITAVSVVVALLVGGMEALGLMGAQLNLTGVFWHWIAKLNEHSGFLGLIIIAIFGVGWLLAAGIYRLMNFDGLEVR